MGVLNKYNLQVGMKLYIRHERNRHKGDSSDLDDYEVEKIGRVYAKLKHPYYRVRIDNLELDGSRGTVYLSPEHYKRQQELNKAWSDFCQAVSDVRHRRPDHISLESINEARQRLGL